MTGDGEDLKVVLSAVNDLVPTLRANDENRFALLLEAPAGHVRSQGVRKLRNARFGEVVLLLVPVDRGVKALRYEAVINRS